MTELLNQYPATDHEKLIHNYNIAVAFGFNKQAAKQFAAGMINDKNIDLSHLKAYEKAV